MDKKDKKNNNKKKKKAIRKNQGKNLTQKLNISFGLSLIYLNQEKESKKKKN